MCVFVLVGLCCISGKPWGNRAELGNGVRQKQRRQWQPTPVFLPGKIPEVEEPGGLPSVGLQSQTRLTRLSSSSSSASEVCSSAQTEHPKVEIQLSK